MSWQGGRQLASMTKGSDTLSFAYNESGLRTSKTVNGVTHSYVWQGSKLAADITDAYALYFHYDSSGEVIGFTRTANGADTEYFYVKNLQGDILKVITATGTEAATYTYDAWGKLLTSTGDLAEVNPLRYRGYFYDTETSLYYLKSRYYDPEVGRFINPDGYNSTGQGIIGTNMFAYCLNNPAIFSDDAGTIAFIDDLIFLGGVVCCTLIFGAAIAPVAWDAAVAVTDYIVGAVNEQLEVFGDIYDNVSGVITEYISQREQISNSIPKDIDQGKTKKYQNNYEWHHIVAQRAPNAKYARMILESVGLDVNSEYNLVHIKTGLHRKLHTNIYYGFVNSVILSAYGNGSGTLEEKKARILNALDHLSKFISALSTASPY